MNLLQLQTEIRNARPDPSIESSITTWLNQVILELAAMYELPSLRIRTPATLTTVATEYLYNLSDTTHPDGHVYLKRCFRITSTTFQQGFTLEPSVTLLDDLDPEHDDTGTAIQRIAVEGDQIAVWPLAAESLSVWYYRRPVDMVQDQDAPDGIPEPYHYRVLVPMVLLRAFRDYPPDLPYGVLGDNRLMLQLWERRLHEGLYGNGVFPGMLHYIQKAQRVQTPRVRGAAYGSRLGGTFR